MKANMKNSIKLIYIIPVCFCMLLSCSSESLGEMVDNPVHEADMTGEEDSSVWLLTPEIELTSSERVALEGINEFSYNVIKEASRLSDDGSFCISPVSASINLGMLANASIGDLRNQIMQALNAETIEKLNVMFEKLMHYLPCEDYGSSLGINNRFWVEKGKTVPEEFKSTVASVFNSGIEFVDFSDENSIRLINDWVKMTTNGKIPGIIDGEIYADLQMFCANIVYFMGDWQCKFGREDTTKEIFHGTSGDKTVDMMHRFAVGTYAANDVVQSVTLSFEGGHNNMELYLPVEGKSIQELTDILTPTFQQELRSNRHPRNIDLAVPSFRSEISVDLPLILRNIGIMSMQNADLSPMGLANMSVNTIQKASIKVDEDGAELAAATVVWAGHGYPTEDNVLVLHFDRPFIYIIRNEATGTILMAGAVTDL